MLYLMREGCSYTYAPLSIARYSFIQLSELEQCRVKTLAQDFNTAAQDSNPGSRNRESEALPLSQALVHLRGTSNTLLESMDCDVDTFIYYLSFFMLNCGTWSICCVGDEHAHPLCALHHMNSEAFSFAIGLRHVGLFWSAFF